MTDAFDLKMMERALQCAHDAAVADEAPIGAVLVDENRTILAAAGNAPIAENDPTAHAEIKALRQAGAILGNYRLPGTTLFVTLEPCAMCAGAIAHARVERIVIAAKDRKGGAVWHGPRYFEQPTCHWHPKIEQGPFQEEASSLLKAFFRAKRQ